MRAVPRCGLRVSGTSRKQSLPILVALRRLSGGRRARCSWKRVSPLPGTPAILNEVPFELARRQRSGFVRWLCGLQDPSFTA